MHLSWLVFAQIKSDSNLPLICFLIFSKLIFNTLSFFDLGFYLICLLVLLVLE